MSSTTTKTGSLTAHPSSYDTTNYSYASISSSYPITNAYTDSSSTSYCQVNWKTGSNAESYVYLKFDFSEIPSNATITSISASVKGYVSTTNNSRVVTRQMQLATGTTLKGSALTMSTSTSAQTFSTVGSWTRAEVEDIGIRFYVKRGTSNTSSNYNFRMYGATITVNYQWVETTYDITVNNSTSATVTANPDAVIAGKDTEIRASTITGLTITDNNTDVTSSFTQRTESSGDYSVVNVGTYGFALNSNNYYESNNKGIHKSAAVCRIDFYVPVAATITFQYINYAEASYDFGVFGNIDVALSNNYYAAGSNGATITDSSYARACNTSSYNSSSVQTLTYSMSSGDHSIWVKFSKDDGSSFNNDTLQFKVSITLDEPFTPSTYYGYDITNVQADHTIVVTAQSTEKLWFKDESPNGWTQAVKAFKKNAQGFWIEQTALANVFDSNKNYVRGNITEKVAYYDTKALSTTSRYNSATSVGNYGLVALGNTGNGYTGAVNAFDTTLTRSNATSMLNERAYCAATTVGNYAVFAGGRTSSSYFGVVDTYNTSLTNQQLSTGLSYKVYDIGVTTVGNYALFIGGRNDDYKYKQANALDNSLTMSTITGISDRGYLIAGATVGSHALFVGGKRETNGDNSYSDSAIVDEYNSSLTKSTLTSLDTAKGACIGASIGNYAIFTGGSTETTYAFDSSLTRITIDSIAYNKVDMASTSLNNYALFGGGSYTTYSDAVIPLPTVHYTATVDAYDSLLIHSNPADLNTARTNFTAVTVGDFALFCGGVYGTLDRTDVVDVYEEI